MLWEQRPRAGDIKLVLKCDTHLPSSGGGSQRGQGWPGWQGCRMRGLRGSQAQMSAKQGAVGSPWEEGREPGCGCWSGHGKKEMVGPGVEGPLQGSRHPADNFDEAD